MSERNYKTQSCSTLNCVEATAGLKPVQCGDTGQHPSTAPFIVSILHADSDKYTSNYKGAMRSALTERDVSPHRTAGSMQ